MLSAWMDSPGTHFQEHSVCACVFAMSTQTDGFELLIHPTHGHCLLTTIPPAWLQWSVNVVATELC